MAIKNGDVVCIEYEAYLVDDNTLFDTSNEEKAKEAGIYNEQYKYAPMPVLVGSGGLFKGLEDAIIDSEVGEEREVILPPELAGGERDPKLIELLPIREFRKKDVEPYPGLEVTIGNRKGTVTSVHAGRVRVDFNSPLAGKTLKYKFTVTEIIEDPLEKAKALLDLNYGTSDGFDFEIRDDSVDVKLSEVCKFDQNWPMARFRLVSALRETFGVDTVRFIEEWTKISNEDDSKESEVVEEASDNSDE
ncbi:MAG: hypothetical protein PWQ88_267 [Candidatus Methanomethylophilaceae archaeon]|nr:MAG: FKBP-type peptidyl-prolyl cis-trans isomerases 2 [Methanomicrobiales archaeon 53_19]MDI3482396.1 hypothetical protein [Candidatus Methanomethylophilaceae archaeon]MDI3542049.1 hypothetical protein [Candidatus Methanomethylophilaceae archaeon]HIJ00768.1 peptidylprolyl isomerase [Candidatus Methanomethylophilaceae archaeon]